jgi:rhodanese-related sulfurtransferase
VAWQRALRRSSGRVRRERDPSLDTERPVAVLDNRTDDDRAQWAIPGILQVNTYDALRNGQAGALADLAIPTDRLVVTVCTAGQVDSRRPARESRNARAWGGMHYPSTVATCDAEGENARC